MSVPLRHLCQLRPMLLKSLPVILRSPLEASGRPTAHLLNGWRQCGAQQTIQTRHLATKKSKAKVKGQPQARVNINAALVEHVINLEEVKQEMYGIIEDLKEDYSKSLSVRTSPGALDHIIVATKDGKFPLNHLGQITLRSPQLMMVNMSSFPEATAVATKAIRESGMNLNPEVDGAIIRVPIPKVTREHRENLAKLAKQFTNKAKESLRKVRSNAVNQTKKSKDSVSEDTIRLIEKKIQEMADEVSAEMDKQLTTKTKELLG
ncbi:ribosome-recycling factor, mitochondrial isoform X2 [Latimeria chalumnae]